MEVVTIARTWICNLGIPQYLRRLLSPVQRRALDPVKEPSAAQVMVEDVLDKVHGYFQFCRLFAGLTAKVGSGLCDWEEYFRRKCERGRSRFGPKLFYFTEVR